MKFLDNSSTVKDNYYKDFCEDMGAHYSQSPFYLRFDNRRPDSPIGEIFLGKINQNKDGIYLGLHIKLYI